MEKRGQGMSISTIILLILGVVVLVVLILGFSIGWQKINPFVSSSNIDTISTQCSTACTTNSVYDFCSRARELNTGDAKYTNVTCNYISAKMPTVGIATCPAVSCSSFVFITNDGSIKTADDLKAKCTTDYSGKTIQTMSGNTLLSATCGAQ